MAVSPMNPQKTLIIGTVGIHLFGPLIHFVYQFASLLRRMKEFTLPFDYPADSILHCVGINSNVRPEGKVWS
jgi:hypothetical protein